MGEDPVAGVCVVAGGVGCSPAGGLFVSVLGVVPVGSVVESGEVAPRGDTAVPESLVDGSGVPAESEESELVAGGAGEVVVSDPEGLVAWSVLPGSVVDAGGVASVPEVSVAGGWLAVGSVATCPVAELSDVGSEGAGVLAELSVAGVETELSVGELEVTGAIDEPSVVVSEVADGAAEGSVVVVESRSLVVARPEFEVASSGVWARTCPQSRKPESVTSTTVISKKILNLRISTLRLCFLWQHRPCTRIVLVNAFSRTPE